jgi:hypothetical protein
MLFRWSGMYVRFLYGVPVSCPVLCVCASFGVPGFLFLCGGLLWIRLVVCSTDMVNRLKLLMMGENARNM